MEDADLSIVAMGGTNDAAIVPMRAVGRRLTASPSTVTLRAMEGAARKVGGPQNGRSAGAIAEATLTSAELQCDRWSAPEEEEDLG